MTTRALRASVAGGGLILAALLLAMALTLTGNVGGTGSGLTPAHAADCSKGVRGKVEVLSKYPKPFASQFKKKLRVQVFNRTGNVKKWYVELYSFSGVLLGKSKPGKWLNWGDRAGIKLKQSMQPGKYTAVLKGEVAGCGETQTTDVVRVRSCLSKLPIAAFSKPGGLAADYNRGGYVSVGIRPRGYVWSPIRGVRSTLTDFDGVSYGSAKLPKGTGRLFGDGWLHHKLTRPLRPGGYTVTISGKAPQPRACGTKSKSIELEFK